MHQYPSRLAVLPLAAFFAALPIATASAQTTGTDGELSYTFLEVDYVNLDIDSVGDEGDFLDDFDNGGGYGFRGSFAFTPNFFGFADYSITDSDATFVDDEDVIFTSSQDVKRLNVGLGVNFGVDPPVIGDSDLVVRAAYVDIDFEDFNFGGGDGGGLDDLDADSSDGYFVDASLRSQVVTWAEASLGVRYTDIESSEEFSVIGNVLLELTPQWGLNLEFDAGDDIGYYLVGVRYSFNR